MKPIMFAVIGARKTPKSALAHLRDIGVLIRELGCYGRSGHAPGADMAAEEGLLNRGLIYLPTATFNDSDPRHAPDRNYITPEDVTKEADQVRAVNSVFTYHPNPDALKPFGHKCMVRNWFQVMGVDGKSPVRAVICWAEPDGKPYGNVKGGTGQAVRIAGAHGIPVFNLFTVPAEQVMEWIRMVKRNDDSWHARAQSSPS